MIELFSVSERSSQQVIAPFHGLRIGSAIRAGACLLLCCTSAYALAPTTSNQIDLGAIEAEKLALNVPGIPSPIYVNVGGDVIPGTPIGGLPYADGGNTCQFAHNYNAVCPYTNDGAPDVVYNFTPASDMFIEVDLCGAPYDSKVYVMTADQSVLCCNDDAGCGPNGFSSLIESCQLTAGTTYYIVVDGWSSVDCGSYNLIVSGSDPCNVQCLPGSVLEQEPVCGDNYSDHYNGGCNSQPPVFVEIPCDPLGDGQTICGEYGGFTYSGLSYRDTDWYVVNLQSATAVSWCVRGEYDTLLGIIDGNQGCPGLSFYDYTIGEPCIEACLAANLPAGTWWFFVATNGFGPTAGACGGDYNATLTGDECPPVSVEMSSWGNIKSLYR